MIAFVESLGVLLNGAFEKCYTDRINWIGKAGKYIIKTIDAIRNIFLI